jgi:hypothetical protein
MRKDHLGNVFPIQGASGTLQIKVRTPAVVAISRATLNGATIIPGATVPVKLSGLLNLQSVAAGAKGVVMSINIPKLGGLVHFQSTSSDGTNWTSKPIPTPTLADYFRGQVTPGTYQARIYLGTGGTNTDVVLGGVIEFSVQVSP